MRGVLIAAMQAGSSAASRRSHRLGGMGSPTRYQRNLAAWHGTWFAGSPDRSYGRHELASPGLSGVPLAQWG
jgi:hypothetical protein